MVLSTSHHLDLDYVEGDFPAPSSRPASQPLPAGFGESSADPFQQHFGGFFGQNFFNPFNNNFGDINFGSFQNYRPWYKGWVKANHEIDRDESVIMGTLPLQSSASFFCSNCRLDCFSEVIWLTFSKVSRSRDNYEEDFTLDKTNMESFFFFFVSRVVKSPARH